MSENLQTWFKATTVTITLRAASGTLLPEKTGLLSVLNVSRRAGFCSYIDFERFFCILYYDGSLVFFNSQ